MRAVFNFLKSNYRVLLIALVLFCCLLSCYPVLTMAGTLNVNLEVGIGANSTTNGISYYIGMVYRFAAAIVGVVAVVMIIIGGIQYSTAAGNKALLGSAKETITSAIIGLVIVLMSYLILGIFSSRFTNLTEPTLDPITVNDPDTGARTPVGDICYPGEKTFADLAGCSTYCRDRWNRNCQPRVGADGRTTMYCCLEEEADDQSKFCETKCENARQCFPTLPCHEVYPIENCRMANHNVDIPVPNPAYDQAACDATKNRMSRLCSNARCGQPAIGRQVNTAIMLCCTEPITSGQPH